MLTGFVLAGGLSTRMKTDKALLRLGDGETLLEHAAAVMAAVAPEVRIVAPHDRYKELSWAGQFVNDIYLNCGPLGGIHAALKSSSTDVNVFLAVDLPAMTAECLRYIAAIAKESDAMVTVPRIDGRPQPLCAVYRRAFGDVAEKALSEGKYKIGALFDASTTRFIEEDELSARGFGAELFRNVNDPGQWHGFVSGT